MIYSASVFGGILASIAMTKAALVPVSKETPLPIPVVSTFAGSSTEGFTNSIGGNARFYDPWGVAISPDLKFALVVDSFANQIRKIIRSTAEVTLLAGTPNGENGSDDGFGKSASFDQPLSIDISPDGTYALIVDHGNDHIRQLIIGTGEVSSFAGSTNYGYKDAVGTNAKFDYPNSVAISPDGRYALVTEDTHNKVRKIDISTRTVTTFAGAEYNSDTPRSDNGVGTNAYFASPFGVAISPNGKYALVADTRNYQIRKIDISTQEVSYVAGGSSGNVNGFGSSVKFGELNEIDFSPDGSYALVADPANCGIRKLNIGTGEVTTFAGHCDEGLIDGPGTTATFRYPTGIAISPSGRSALVGDVDGNNVRKIQILPPPRAKVSPSRLR